jgi:hypothetical protein
VAYFKIEDKNLSAGARKPRIYQLNQYFVQYSRQLPPKCKVEIMILHPVDHFYTPTCRAYMCVCACMYRLKCMYVDLCTYVDIYRPVCSTSISFQRFKSKIQVLIHLTIQSKCFDSSDVNLRNTTGRDTRHHKIHESVDGTAYRIL